MTTKVVMNNIERKTKIERPARMNIRARGTAPVTTFAYLLAAKASKVMRREEEEREIKQHLGASIEDSRNGIPRQAGLARRREEQEEHRPEHRRKPAVAPRQPLVERDEQDQVVDHAQGEAANGDFLPPDPGGGTRHHQVADHRQLARRVGDRVERGGLEKEEPRNPWGEEVINADVVKELAFNQAEEEQAAEEIEGGEDDENDEAEGP
nr:hypothetical protein Iba_chr15fCG2610 [Ipomoea batatas]